MSLVCESEINVHNELALRFSVFIKPPPVIEYIKTISSSVGASHVLAVFEEQDSIKVFFDDKRLIESLIKSGIHVLGHHVRADYVVPPGTKVMLSNIDPVITNFDVMRLLSMYGTVVSPVIRPPICDDVELCHIVHGVRHVYMVLDSPIPSKLEFKYGDQLCFIKTSVEDTSAVMPTIKTDCEVENDMEEATFVDSPSDNTPSPDVLNSSQNPDAPVVVSVESASSEDQIGDDEVKEEWVPVKRRGRFSKGLRLKRRKVTPMSQAAKKIQQTVKHKWGTRNLSHFKKRRGRKPLKRPPVLEPLSPSSSTDVETSVPPLLSNEASPASPENTVLNAETLKMFLTESKHHRAPFELVKKYLGNDYSLDLVNSFIDQLEMYKCSQSNVSLRIRLNRLIKTISDAV